MPQNDQKTDLSAEQSQSYLEDTDPKDEDPVIPDSSTPEQDKALRAATLTAYGKFSTIGIFLLLSIAFGYAIGHFFDNLFHLNKPIFTVFWIICGIAATIKEFLTMLKNARKLGDDDTSPKV